ncbi:MAG: hypothetical protein WBE26_03995 [Phycisphaerae bacterium]
MRFPNLASTVAMIVCLAFPAAARGVDTYWQVATGDWHTSGNWTTGVPTSEDIAHVNNGGAASVYWPGGCLGLRLGESAGESGTVQIAADLTTGSLELGDGGAYIGVGGTGSLIIQDGGSLSSSSPVTGILGAESTGEGNLTVTGAGSSWSTTWPLLLGSAGTGSLTIQNGGGVSNHDAILGVESTGSGTVTVNGNGSTWNNWSLDVGFYGTGSVTIENGGEVYSGRGEIGGSNGNGTVTVDGVGSSWDSYFYISVGTEGTGSLTVRNGGEVSTDEQLGVGHWDYGTGSLTIQSGGTVSNTLNGYIGYASGADGTVIVDGGGSTWLNLASLYVGGTDSTPGGTGELTVENGATVYVADTLGVWGSGTINVHDGQLAADIVELDGGGKGERYAEGMLNLSDAGAELTVSNLLRFGAGSTFTAVSGSTIHMTGADFENLSAAEGDLEGLANVEFIFEGGPGEAVHFEVACEDKGAVTAGHVNNFALGKLAVGGVDIGVVRLVDNTDNGNRGGAGGDAETLYVDSLILNAGSELDLNNLHLCWRTEFIDNGGTILNGEVTQVELHTITVCWDGSADYATIQEGIDAADYGDEVVVCDGTYTGWGNKELDFGGKAITVRSENGPDTCIIDCEYWGRGFFFHSGETGASVVDGFTISNGWPWDEDGGGIYCYNSTPTITNCTISGNSADMYGGGIYCYDSSPTITNCTIVGNWSDDSGGGIYCYDSSPTITDCTISANTSGFHGGAINCSQDSSPTITNCTISGNSAYVYGGGISCWSGSSPTITNCTISGNTSGEDWYGGGISCGRGSATITNCTISGNTARWGGAIYCQGSEEGPSSPTITNCTITGNTASDSGGAICCFNQNSPTITNCTLWGDAAPEGPEIALQWGFYGPHTLTVSYSDVQGAQGAAYVENGCTLIWGEGNINADPLFVDPEGPDDDPDTWEDNDYHLFWGSPCIDAGNNAAVPGDTADLDNDGDVFERTPLDLDGCPRFVDDPPPGGTGVPDPPDYPDIVDMGAYELSDCSGTGEACCLEDATCLNEAPGDCEDMLGTPQGAGTQCTEERACCLPNGTCEMVDPLCCDEMGGEFSPIGEPVCLGDGNGNEIDDACEAPTPKRPMAEEYSSPCSSDSDCPNASVCVLPPEGEAGDGICYVPKNRYLSIARHPQQAANTARRIRCARDDQAVVAWVGEPVWQGAFGGVWLSDLVETPVYSGDFETADGEWPDVVQVRGAEIGPAQALHVQAIHVSGDPDDEDSYSEPLELPTAPVWGDVVGEYSGGSCTPPNGVANQDDIDAVVDAFYGVCPCQLWCDLAPEITNLSIDFDDLTAVSRAATGEPYPWQTPCPAAPPPQPELPAFPKNRYISFAIGNPGRDTALRVALTASALFPGDMGMQWWVGPPGPVAEAAGSTGSTPLPTFMAAELENTWTCMDWSTVGLLNVSGCEVHPGATYDVQAIDCTCDPSNAANYSAPLSITTSLWGDVVGDCSVTPCTPPDGNTNFDDISSLVDKFRNLAGAPRKARADIAGDPPVGIPDRLVNFVDISYDVDAFRGLPYPFPGPGGCP